VEAWKREDESGGRKGISNEALPRKIPAIMIIEFDHQRAKNAKQWIV
jgi:hypothetical protein